MVAVLPGAIWAGALTPVVTSTIIMPSASWFYPASPYLDVPRYSPASAEFWNVTSWVAPSDTIRTEKGIFTYSPNYALQGLILNVAASATSPDGTAQNHTKIDNSRFTYLGRSFGVGSSVGLVDDSLNSTNTLGYNYTEVGYSAQVTCIVNDTSDWTLTLVSLSDDETFPNTYLAAGNLVNGASDGYAACGLYNDNDIVALVGHTFNDQNVFAIASGASYAALDGVQCNAEFVPTNFSISVNVTESTVIVTPLLQSVPVPNMESTGAIVAITMREPTSFSQQNACDLYRSVIGDTLTSNIANINASWDPTLNALTGYQSKTTLQGVEDSLTSMVDNVLLAYSSAQLMIANDTYQAPTTALIKSVRIGEAIYIYTVAAVNFLVVLVFIFEISRTRGWKDLRRFDYTNIKSLVVGTSMGGTAIANAVRRAHASERTVWDGTSGDVIAGNIAVRLTNHGEDLALAFHEEPGQSASRSEDYEMLVHYPGETSGASQGLKVDRSYQPSQSSQSWIEGDE